eukprot:Seg1297.4 transcript_id=Seg1297.4/GoldUCD/mRNA.D3Y31 product="hypothetical protein" protein_id=Seg1297.4/GoldUCD/D3Y31
MGSKKNKKYKKKSKFHGNRFVQVEIGSGMKRKLNGPNPNIAADNQQETCGTPPGSKRLRLDEVIGEQFEDYFIIINFKIMKEMISTVGKCLDCGSQMEIDDVLENRMGLAHKLTLKCTCCNWEMSQYSSSKTKPKATGGRSFFESNVRLVTAFREIGKGHQGIDNFSRIMNMHGLSWPGYENIKGDMIIAYENAANESMRKAAEKVHNETEQKLAGDPSVMLCDVSIDGTWQKRGHASLNGAVTAICNGLCVDKHVMSKYCRLCQKWESKKGTTEYDEWKLQHICKKNHPKSSGAMEGAGAIAMFTSSVQKHKLIYHNYIGDGDTSSFKEVSAANPYSDYGIKPRKLECIGHVQKRLGTRLRDLRKSYKNLSTPLSGRGKLTDKVINSLQNFYGIAIRENQGNLYQMKKAVGAILYHCTNYDDDEKRHQYCPRDAKSWCKFQKDKVTGTNTRKESINLPMWIHELIKPIFRDLSSDELLSRCLHGKTQNANESLNNVI